jgi:hypothetical protein
MYQGDLDPKNYFWQAAYAILDIGDNEKNLPITAQ